MATYAIGDIQGCYRSLRKLLDKVEFDETRDTLWCAGDLVNRGPESLETLRFLFRLPKTKIVLGNHDLHLLATAHGVRAPKNSDTLDEILASKDKLQLLEWLHHQPLLHHSKKKEFTMVHAGIPPAWDLEKAKKLSKEVSTVLQNDYQANRFFKEMYGNEPATWSDKLEGMERIRVIVNYFTRMRFCSAEGTLDLKTKEGVEAAPKGMLPWFVHGNRKMENDRIIFGHWAALEGKTFEKNVYALDTGCVWGGSLTALNLKNLKRKSCKSID